MTVLFWMSFGTLWILVAVHSFVLLEVLHQIGDIRTRLITSEHIVDLDSLAGTPLPELAGLAAETLNPAGWDDFLVQERGVGVLFTTRCTTCITLAKQITKYGRDRRTGSTPLFVILQASLDEAKTFLHETRIDPRIVLIDPSASIGERLAVTWSPAAIAIERRRIVEGAIVTNLDELKALSARNDARLAEAVMPSSIDDKPIVKTG